MKGTPGPDTVSTKLQRIAEMARAIPAALTTLAYHIDIDLLREAHRRSRKNGATGVDEQTAAAYEQNLDENLARLLEEFKSGSYYAPPVRRVHIPKGDGNKTRPIGIPTYEDKVLQRAVTMVLEAVYEQQFFGCSYGFRPGKSAHQALQVLWEGIMSMRGAWVIEVDIESFFDSLDHQVLRGMLDQRIRDGVIRRAVDKWLNAGVLEEGQISRPEKGTPQGGVISPLLANVYLHEVMDRWFAEQVQPRIKGRSMMVRYADDLLMVFSSETEARRVFEVLPKRFGKYGLRLHPDKTRLVRFHAPTGSDEDPGNFDLLGFRHYWGKSRRGSWIVKRKTAPSRFTRALKQIGAWCRRYMHIPVDVQHDALVKKLRGHYAYYGITGNADGLARFLYETTQVWRKWLHRRTGRGHMPWPRFIRLLSRYPLPRPRVVHSIYKPA